jgi:gas vesicle protein
MNSYAREIRKMLETLRLVRRPNGSWKATFLIGAGLGAITAVFLTPSSGKKMRKLVRSKARKAASGTEKKIAAPKSAATKSANSNGARKQAHA